MSQAAMILAVHEYIKGSAVFDDCDVQTEFDTLPHEMSSSVYVAIGGGGWRKGPRHDSSGGVKDKIYSVSIAVSMRMNAMAQDRLDEPWLATSNSMEAYLDEIDDIVDFQYRVMNRANEIITERTGSTYGFSEPLRFESVDAVPGIVSSTNWGQVAGEQRAGIRQSIRFGGARRIVVRTQAT